MSPVDIHCRMHAMIGDKCVDVSTVMRWVPHLREEVGHADLWDEAGSVSPGRNSESC
jgi:hypothetical protein